MSIRTYSKLISLNSFEDRFDYLKLDGIVGSETFGYDRYLNQALYKSKEWKKVRNYVISRDMACDLAMEGHEIYDMGFVRIHHMNPITREMIINRDPIIFDPEFLITTILRTHNAIHFGDSDQLQKEPIIRTANDTCPWK